MQLGAGTLLFCLSQYAIPFCTLSSVYWSNRSLLEDLWIQHAWRVTCKKAKLQAGIKPTALCSAIDKENSIESLLNFAILYIQLLLWLCTLSPTVFMPVSWLLCHMLWSWLVTMCDVTILWLCHTFCDSVTVMWYFPHSTLVIIWKKKKKNINIDLAILPSHDITSYPTSSYPSSQWILCQLLCIPDCQWSVS